mmetsp:Transcript_33573/g.106089  ORF Transcript_33573/g.106089 Transcript_33573/m.106089 type:complete len:392 (+) Transcript_33573:163-1338(+)
MVRRLGLLLLGAGAAEALRLTLFDMPVSNNGARARYIIQKKALDSNDVEVVSPMELGGLRSDEYLAKNPQGKMPLLSVDDSTFIYESDAIARFLLAEFRDRGEAFVCDDPLICAKSDLLVRLHDGYIQPIQGCMYKALPPFGTFGTRSLALDDIRKQLKILCDAAESNRVGDGPYILGTDKPTLADATIIPTLVFTSFMLPRHWGFSEEDAFGGAYLKDWWKSVQAADSVAANVVDEILAPLRAWDEKGRWNTIHGATTGSFFDSDEANDSVFGKIVRGEIPSKPVYEDKHCMAFPDLNPAAPEHLLVIPKSRNGLRRLTDATAEHTDVLGNLMLGAVRAHAAAAEARGEADDEAFDGLRVVVNDGPVGGQEVDHLHLHVLSGRSLKWPPG